MKPNSLFSPIPGKKSHTPHSLFLTYGRKSRKPNSLFGLYAKRVLKPNSLLASFKRSLKPNSLFKTYGKRSMKPNSLFGAYKKAMKPNSLFQMDKRSFGNFSLSPYALFGLYGPGLDTPGSFGLYDTYANKEDAVEYDHEEPDYDNLESEDEMDKLMVKRADSEFLAARGKKDASFWAAR